MLRTSANRHADYGLSLRMAAAIGALGQR